VLIYPEGTLALMEAAPDQERLQIETAAYS